MTAERDTAAHRARVFLSWSGERSKALAIAVGESITALSDHLEPWMSDELEPGTEWANALIPQIQEARIAILCLTNRNLTAPWIAFETGAYYMSPLREGVIPFLLDLDVKDLPFPLGLFQSLRADWPGTKALFVRLGRLVDIDADAVGERLVKDIWEPLRDRIDVIRKIDFDGTRTEEPGNWLNIANAFYLGHDLRWTMDELTNGGDPEDVKHGFRQILHHADELGLSAHDHFLILARQATEVLQLPAEEWTPEVRDKLGGGLKDALERFGGLLIRRQPGYRPYPPENQRSWLAIQADGRA